MDKYYSGYAGNMCSFDACERAHVWLSFDLSTLLLITFGQNFLNFILQLMDNRFNTFHIHWITPFEFIQFQIQAMILQTALGYAELNRI